MTPQSNPLFFSEIVGSRAYGLEIENSDIDLLFLGTAPSINSSNKIHYMPRDASWYLSAVSFQMRHPMYLECLYPGQFLGDSEIIDYILSHREDHIRFYANTIWDLLWEHASRLAMFGEHYYRAFPKRLAYSIMRFETLYEYSVTENFQTAFRPCLQLRNYLLSVRKGEVPVKDVIAHVSDSKMRAAKSRDFYNRISKGKKIDEMELMEILHKFD